MNGFGVMCVEMGVSWSGLNGVVDGECGGACLETPGVLGGWRARVVAS